MVAFVIVPLRRVCIFLGYLSGYKGYKLLDIETHSVSISRHVIFYEDIFPFVSSNIKEDTRSFFSHIPSHATFDTSQSSSDTHLPKDEISSKVLVPSESKFLRPRKRPSHLQNYHCYNTSSSTANTRITIPYPVTNYISYTSISEPFYIFLSIITKALIPHNYKEALKDKVCVDSIGLEIDAFERTETWTITELPPGKEAIGCRWIRTINIMHMVQKRGRNLRLSQRDILNKRALIFLTPFLW